MGPLTTAGAIAASLIAILTLAGMVVRGYRHGRAAYRDDVRQIVHDATAPIRSDIVTVKHRVGRIEAELRPNGGRTLRDAVDRVEGAVAPGPDS